MDLTIVALVLFLAMVACWVVLPSVPSKSAPRREVEPANQGSVGQLA